MYEGQPVTPLVLSRIPRVLQLVEGDVHVPHDGPSTVLFGVGWAALLCVGVCHTGAVHDAHDMVGCWLG